MNRVLVTGAQGFTGQYMVPALQSRGSEVHGLLRPGVPHASLPNGALAHVADLADPAGIAAVVDAIKPDVVVHLAGISNVAHSDPREIYEANLIGSRNLLQSLVECEVAPRAILLASSANVYGNQRQGILSEDVQPDPINEYGISKLAMEFVARLFMDRLPIIITRPFNYTGVGQSTDFIIPKIVDHARRRASRIALGNLDVERDFSDVRSVVACYLRLLDTPSAIGGLFNVCSSRAYTLRSVIRLVEELADFEMEVEANPALIRGNEVKTLYGDNRRLEATIGPIEMLPLDATLRWMIEA